MICVLLLIGVVMETSMFWKGCAQNRSCMFVAPYAGLLAQIVGVRIAWFPFVLRTLDAPKPMNIILKAWKMHSA